MTNKQALRELAERMRKAAEKPVFSRETGQCIEAGKVTEWVDELEAAFSAQGSPAEFDERAKLKRDMYALFQRWSEQDDDQGMRTGVWDLIEKAYAAGQAAQPLQREVKCARCREQKDTVFVDTGFAGEREPLCGACVSKLVADSETPPHQRGEGKESK